jgi:hypothetical protein
VKREQRFLIGYEGDVSVYGQDGLDKLISVESLTITKARQSLRRLRNWVDNPVVLYELREVRATKPAEKAKEGKHGTTDRQ